MRAVACSGCAGAGGERGLGVAWRGAGWAWRGARLAPCRTRHTRRPSRTRTTHAATLHATARSRIARLHLAPPGTLVQSSCISAAQTHQSPPTFPPRGSDRFIYSSLLVRDRDRPGTPRVFGAD